MPNIAIKIEYNGANFCGWQKQPGERRSIQEELQRAISTVLRTNIRSLQASGRTDAGVHARGQVVNFHLDSPPDLRKLSYGVSSILHPEVSIVAAAVVPDGFNARASAIRKQYTYTILYRDCPATLDQGRVWHLRPTLNIEQMMVDAAKFVGVHDFSSFRGSGCGARNPVREIQKSTLTLNGAYLTYSVIGTGFLKQMVRNIVGVIVDRARGRLELSVEEIFAAKDRKVAGITAPPQGLCLDWVEYDSEIMNLFP